MKPKIVHVLFLKANSRNHVILYLFMTPFGATDYLLHDFLFVKIEAYFIDEKEISLILYYVSNH